MISPIKYTKWFIYSLERKTDDYIAQKKKYPLFLREKSKLCRYWSKWLIIMHLCCIASYPDGKCEFGWRGYTGGSFAILRVLQKVTKIFL